KRMDDCAAADFYRPLQLGRGGLFSCGKSATERVAGPGHWQAMDVAFATRGGETRNQRAARAGRPRGRADDDFAGCDPQFFRARVSPASGCGAWKIHTPMVQGHAAWRVSHFLFAILRRATLGDDRPRGSDGATGL